MSDEQNENQIGDGRTKWRRNTATGGWVMPALQEKYLLEQCVAFPPSPKSDKAWAEEHGVDPRTLRRWKADSRFRERWEAEADDRNMGPEFLEPIIANMHAVAASPTHPGAMKAAELLLKFTDRMKPPESRVVIDQGASIEDMSDEELAAAVANLVKDAADGDR